MAILSREIQGTCDRKDQTKLDLFDGSLIVQISPKKLIQLTGHSTNKKYYLHNC